MAKKVGWKQYAEEQMKKYPVDTKGMTHEEVLQAMIDYGTDLSGVDTTGLAEAKMAKAAPTLPPTTMPHSSGRAFFTKEAQEEKLINSVLGGRVSSKEASVEAAKQKAILKNSRAADLARFQSLPKEERDKFNNDFENWVPTVYSSRTKGLAQIQNEANQKAGDPAKFKQREAPGMLTRGARIINDLATRNYIPGLGDKNVVYHANDLLYQLAGGQNKEDRDLATYQRLKSPERDMGIRETIVETGKGMYDAGVKGTIREMFSPDELGTNALNFVPIAGPVGVATKGLQLANRLGTGTKVAAKLPSLVKSTSKVMEKALGTHLAGAAAGVGAGGLTGMALGEGDAAANFVTGAGIGLVGQGIGSLAAKGVGKGAKALFGGKATPEVAPAPFHGEIEARLRAKMGATGATERPALSTEDILDAPSVRQFANNDTPLGRDRGGMKAHEVEDLIATHGETLYPGISQINPADQADALRARLRSQISELEQSRKAQAQAEASARAEADANKKTSTGRGKQYTQADVDLLLSNYIPENATPEQVAKIMATTNVKTLRDTHAKLTRAAEQGLTQADGRPIPLRDDIRSVNVLEERVKTADAEANARVEKARKDAKTAEETKAAEELAAAEALKSADRKKDLDYEQKVTSLSIALRLAAGDEAVMPGALKADILKMTPENMGIIMDDMIAGSGRFDEYGDLISDAIGQKNFEDLLDLRKASGGIPGVWENGTKRIQDRAAKDLAKTTATQADQKADLDVAAKRDEVAATVDLEEQAKAQSESDAAAKDAARRAKTEKNITESLGLASEQEVAAMLEKMLKESGDDAPMRAEMLGLDPKLVDAAFDQDNPLRDTPLKKLQTALIDAAKRVKAEGKLPGGFM